MASTQADAKLFAVLARFDLLNYTNNWLNMQMDKFISKVKLDALIQTQP